MATRIVIDTDALVGLLRADPQWTERIKNLEQATAPLCTTDINAFELYLGAYLSKNQAGNIAAVKGLLNTLKILSTNEDAMEVAARSAAALKKRGEPLDIKDLLIASLALVNGASILTGNQKHFKRIPQLEVLGPEP